MAEVGTPVEYNTAVINGDFREDAMNKASDELESHVDGFGLILLAFQAVGVVYGDIGTSPLYVYPSIFPDNPPSEEDVYGALSLILYTITISLVIKYALIVLYADDAGNGGTFALYSILRRQGEQGIKGPALPSDLSLKYYRTPSGIGGSSMTGGGGVEEGKDKKKRQNFISNRRVQTTIRCLVVIGVGAIMGDGVLTPAISVVSACEGLQVGIPSFSRQAIVGMSVGIIALVFLAQQFGTNRISFFFSPVITLWLLANACIGIFNIATYDPTVFKALSPTYWFSYFLRNGATGWKSLGGVLLCITGTEALFADLGHFNRRSVLLSCLGLLYPCIVLTYCGQAAYLAKNPTDVSLAYWKSLPTGFLWPMLVLATFATVIASQALISAVFQIVYQAIAQGFVPRFGVVHTSEHIQGQVYIPIVNWVLMTLTIIVVVIFQESAKLGQAYGLAVIVDMMLTSHFMTLVIYCVWHKPGYLAAPFYFGLLIVEGSFLSASVGKIPQGGWFSVMMAAIYASIMFWWYWGTARKKQYFATHFTPKLPDFFMLLRNNTPPVSTCLALKEGAIPLTRTPGVGLYYSEAIYGTPPVMVELLQYFPTLHQVVIVITNRFVPVPGVSDEERFLVEQVGIAGFYHCIARYGYMEQVRQDGPFVTAVLCHVEALLYRAFEDTMSGAEDNEGGESGSEQLSAEQAEGKARLLRELEELKASRPKRTEGSARLPVDADNMLQTVVQGVTLDASSLPRSSSFDPDLERGHESDDTHHNSNNNNNTWPIGVLPPKGVLPSTSTSTPTGLGSLNNELQIGGVGEREGLPPIAPSHSKTRAVVTSEDLSANPVQAATREWADKMVDALSHVNELPAHYRKLAAIGGEIRAVSGAQENGKVVYVMASTRPKYGRKKNIWRRFFLEAPFMFLVHNFHVDACKVFGIPEDKLCEVGMQYHL